MQSAATPINHSMKEIYAMNDYMDGERFFQ